MRRILIILVLISFAVGCESEPTAFVHGLPDGQLVVAHRGGAQIAPENTMAAFLASAAPSVAAEVMELDIHTSSDDHLMVIHDRSIDRVTGEGNGCDTEQDTEEETYGSMLVHDLTYDELRQYNAGYCWEDPDAAEDAPESVRYPYRSSNTQIPTLSQVMESLGDQRFIIEIKQQEPSLVELVFELVERQDALDRVCFLNFDPDGVSELASEAPEGTCVALSSEGIRCWASEAIMPFGGGACERYDLGMVPHENGGYDLKKERFVRNIQATGAPVFMWTINDEPMMEQVLDLGVDGVVTDRPDLLRELIGAP